MIISWLSKIKMDKYLASSEIIDWENPEVMNKAKELSEVFGGRGQGMESLLCTYGRVLDFVGRSEEAIEVLENNLPGTPKYAAYTRAYLAQA